MRKILLAIAKVEVSAAILLYLGRQAWRDDSFHELVSQPKRWDLFLLGGVCTFLSVALTFARWWYFVRNLELTCTLRQAFRLGFLGYLFNFFSLGVIGGDVLRSVFLARHNPGRRSAAVASVFVDRFIGLYVLCVVAMLGTWFLDLPHLGADESTGRAALLRLCQLINLIVIGGAIGITAIFAPGLTAQRWGSVVGAIPLVNRFQHRVVAAVDACRRHAGVVAIAVVVSVGVHVLNVLGIYCVALALPGDEPSLATHFIVAPLAILAGMVPLPGGLGAVEYALDFLYRAVASATAATRQGFLVALGYRVVTMAIAAVGLGYYLVSRGEVRELIAQAEEDSESPVATPTAANGNSTT